MAVYKVVMEYEVVETHVATVFVEAADEGGAMDKARDLNRAGRAPWFLACDDGGSEAEFVEVVVADAAELAAERAVKHTLAYELPAEGVQ